MVVWNAHRKSMPWGGHNVYYMHANRAARRLGDRGALVFNLGCVDHDLTGNSKEVQEHFKRAIKKISTQ